MNLKQTKNCHGCQASLSMDAKQCPYCHQRQQWAWEIRFAQFFSGLLPKNTPATRFLLIAIVVYFIIISIDILMHPDYGLREVLLAPPGELIYRWGGAIAR